MRITNAAAPQEEGRDVYGDSPEILALGAGFAREAHFTGGYCEVRV